MADSTNNYATKQEARFKVPIHGQNGKGHLFIHAANRDDNEAGELSLQKCEIEVLETVLDVPDEFKNRNLLVYDFKKNGPVDEFCPPKEGQPRTS